MSNSTEQNLNAIETRQAQQKEALLELFRKSPIIQSASEKAGVGRATYYRWRKEDPAFAAAADTAIADGRFLINDLAEAQLMSAIRDKNMTAIIFWLKYNHPSYASRLEITGRIAHFREELTEEEKALIEEALRLAMPRQQENHD